MTERTEKLIDELEEARKRNNTGWMEIIRIAFRHAPKETKLALKRIDKGDKGISDIVKELCK